MNNHRSPREIWNNAVYSYESIPDMPSDSERFLSSSERNSDPKAHSTRKKPKGRFLLVGALGAFCLAALLCRTIQRMFDNAIDDSEIKTLPTLLSVVDTETNYFVYALNNSLYAQMQVAEYVDIEKTEFKGQEIPKLLLDKTQIQIDESISLTWTMGRNSEGNVMLQEEDIIALYCGNSLGSDFLEAATIKQIRATSVNNGGNNNGWFISNFPILRQDVCHFRLYTRTERSAKQLIHLTSSDEFQISLAKETPTAIHLAFSEDQSKMTVQFTTGEIHESVPVARYWKTESNHNSFVLSEGTTDTYRSLDLCQSPANLEEAGKFYPPGMLHTITLKELEPDTRYEYQVGLRQEETVLVWSDVYSFTSSREEGDSREFSYIVYGDQGCPNPGWEDGKSWLVAMMEREDPTSIHHFGDISYAQGAAHVWDEWFQMIQPFSTRVPLMIGIGNHEYDHTDGGKDKDPSGVKTDRGFMPWWGNFADDSGGECGVPMAKRFKMPSSKISNGVFWYSYDYATVHTTVISSEHDLSRGSPQYKFLEADLKAVDRKNTPWVVVESHRPLYEGEGGEHWWPNKLVGESMRDEFEVLLKSYKVDLVLAGHYHEYHRTCDGVFKSKCDNGGPIHVTVGSAGGHLDDGFTYSNPWTARSIRGEFGYGRITVSNATDLHFEFIRHGDSRDPLAGQVHDEFWIHRERD